MRGFIRVGVVAAALTAGLCGGAFAQASPTSGGGAAGSSAYVTGNRQEYQTPAPTPSGPTFRLYQLPVQVASPVARPYYGSAYADLDGQPEISGDSLLEGDAPSR